MGRLDNVLDAFGGRQYVEAVGRTLTRAQTLEHGNPSDDGVSGITHYRSCIA